MVNEQRFFREFIRLMGKRVEIGLSAPARQVTGTVVNSMFDSVLLDTANGPTVVRFNDINYLTEESDLQPVLPAKST